MNAEDEDEREPDETPEEESGEERKPEETDEEEVIEAPDPEPGLTAPLDHVTDEEKDKGPVAVMPGAGPTRTTSTPIPNDGHRPRSKKPPKTDAEALQRSADR